MRHSSVTAIGFVLMLCAFAGHAQHEKITLVLSQGKVLGEQRLAMDNLLREFTQENPGIEVVSRELPNSSDKQHQYYLTSLGGGARDIDLFAMDVIWVSEFAHADWLLPFTLSKEEQEEFLPGPVRACTYQGKLVALPWYVDAGLLYYRRDLLEKYGISVPATWTWDDIAAATVKILQGEKTNDSPVRYGLLCQGKHYEGLVCAFLEIFRGCGGDVFTGSSYDKASVVLDSAQSQAAWRKFASLIHEECVIPGIINNLDEERSRRMFEAGEAVFLRNWPYVWSNIEGRDSRLQGKVGVAPMPHLAGHESSATLGGWQLAVSAHSRYPAEAAKLARFLTSFKAQKILALHLGNNPTRKALYQDPEVVAKNPFFKDLYMVFVHAAPRPVTPLYPQISQILQRELSEIISAHKDPTKAALNAAFEVRGIYQERQAAGVHSWQPAAMLAFLLMLTILSLMLFRGSVKENLAAFAYLWPALLVITVVALLPLLYALFLSFYQVEMAAIIHPDQWAWCGLQNFSAICSDPHFGRALVNTFAIAGIAVTLELLLGLGIALVLARPFLGKGPLRALILLPWILPTVVAGKMWSWIFATSGGVANYCFQSLGLITDPVNWMNPVPAFCSIIVAEVWKTTPFMAILLLAGLTNIPGDLYQAARIDGASSWYVFTRITLPLLRPAILLALLFRTMDALRIFDVVYAMTEYAESTKTLSIYIHQKLGTGDLGYSAALSLVTFLLIFGVSLLYMMLLGKKMGVKT
jgi:multiple sugar transport system substrate-binding protein